MSQTTPYAESPARVHRLANGVTVVLEPLPFLRSVSTGVWIKTGSAGESPDQCGISHFLEHLFFKGTKSRTARQLVEAIERRGGHLNAFTSRDYTCLYAKTLDDDLATAIEVLGDIIKNSTFCDFEKERNVILEEVASIEDAPEDLIHDILVERVWPDHPQGRPVTGTQESVSALTPRDVRTYFETHYRPDNIVVSLAGGFEEGAAFDLVCSEFEAIPAAPLDTIELPPPQFAASAGRLSRDIAQSHICLAFPGPGRTDPNRFTYDVLSNALGGGATSRLFERIREKEGLAYNIYTYHSCHVRSGLLGVYAAVAAGNLTRTLDLVFKELREVRDKRLPDDEVELNRSQLKGGLLMALEGTFNRMSRLAKSLMYHGRVLPIDEIIATLDTVSGEDIHRLAQQIFTPEQCGLLVLGPDNGPAVTEVAL
jgi:predicted Zn-dependent peptidase